MSIIMSNEKALSGKVALITGGGVSLAPINPTTGEIQ